MYQIYFILESHNTCFSRSFRPSSGDQDCTYRNKTDTAVCFLVSRQQYLFDKCLLSYVLYIHSTHNIKFQHNFYSKTNKMHQCIKFILFWNDTLHVSDGLSVHHQQFKTVHTVTKQIQLSTS